MYKRQNKEHRFSKGFTVSPFNPVNMDYVWRSSVPENNLTVSINTYLKGALHVHASMKLARREFSRSTVRYMLFKFPLNTLGVIAGIYWEAARLFIKGVPFLGKNKVIVNSSD